MSGATSSSTVVFDWATMMTKNMMFNYQPDGKEKYRMLYGEEGKTPPFAGVIVPDGPPPDGDLNGLLTPANTTNTPDSTKFYDNN